MRDILAVQSPEALNCAQNCAYCNVGPQVDGGITDIGNGWKQMRCGCGATAYNLQMYNRSQPGPQTIIGNGNIQAGGNIVMGDKRGRSPLLDMALTLLHSPDIKSALDALTPGDGLMRRGAGATMTVSNSAYGELRGVALTGNQNRIERAVDCVIIGNGNEIRYVENCSVQGNNNKIDSADENSEISGNFNSVRAWRKA